MPTDFTAAVQDGSVTEFKDFARSCASAFVTELPLGIYYYNRGIEDAISRLKTLEALTDKQASRESIREYADAMDSLRKSWERQAQERARYEAMLAKVKAWIPPSEWHETLKAFMQEQLINSLDDCSYEMPTPKLLTGAEWIERELEKTNNSIIYYTKLRAEEIFLTECHNKRLRELENA